MNEPLAIISAGIVIAALEIFVPGMVVIWIGAGFILAGLIALFAPMGIWAMIALGGVIGIVLMVAFRDMLLKAIQNAKEIPDNVIIHEGDGILRGERVHFSGTEFSYESEEPQETFNDGEKVHIVRIENNTAYIRKKKGNQ